MHILMAMNLKKTAERLKISKNDIREFGDLVVKSVEEELQKLRRKIEFASSVDIATKASDIKKVFLAFFTQRCLFLSKEWFL